MTGIEATLARVLAEHRLIGVKGGTATGSRWICDCSAEGRTPGARDYAEWLHAEHAATRAVFALRDDETLVERVAEAIGKRWVDGYDVTDADLARAAVTAMLGGE